MEVLNTKEAADFLHCTTGTLYQWCHKRYVPHMNTGKKLLFEKAVLEDWLKSKRVLTEEELQKKAENKRG